MKQLFLALLLIIVTSSCSNVYLDEGKSLIDSQEETTLKVTNQIDTSASLYHIIINDDILYAVNSETKVVEYKVTDSTGINQTMFSIIILFGVIIIIMLSIFKF